MTRVTEVKFHGRKMDSTTEFHVPWQGRFRFKWADLDDDGNIVSITCWGGSHGYRAWRTFAPERIKKVKNKTGTVR